MNMFQGKAILEITHIKFLQELIKECKREDITKTYQNFIDNNAIPLTWIITDNPPFRFMFDSIALNGTNTLVQKIQKYSPATHISKFDRSLKITPRKISKEIYKRLLNDILAKNINKTIQLFLLHPIELYEFGKTWGYLIKEKEFIFLGEEIEGTNFYKPEVNQKYTLQINVPNQPSELDALIPRPRTLYPQPSNSEIIVPRRHHVTPSDFVFTNEEEPEEELEDEPEDR